eukprot:CAMPEP_0119088526 /NCGR_PEP_ID=MMETSP1178-20130426/145762_1 /TAXON_ID=33656 /ORGANISM="unid sp, Strain CCMP2000" /LENGTH=45 /DNA_ID= /DNA_START= /DNA_END= /DNA_ORIENTATION=
MTHNTQACLTTLLGALPPLSPPPPSRDRLTPAIAPGGGAHVVAPP